VAMQFVVRLRCVSMAPGGKIIWLVVGKWLLMTMQPPSHLKTNRRFPRSRSVPLFSKDFISFFARTTLMMIDWVGCKTVMPRCPPELIHSKNELKFRLDQLPVLLTYFDDRK
jgi:hypothetical protein